MTAVIIASGTGSRLGSECADIPKALISFDKKPFLQSLIGWLFANGISDVVIVSHTHSDKIQKLIDSMVTPKPVKVIVEKVLRNPLMSIFHGLLSVGTANALVLVADTLWDVDLDKLYAYHREHDSVITVLSTPTTLHRSSQSTLFHANCEGRIIQVMDIGHQCSECMFSKGMYMVDVRRFMQRINWKKEQTLIRDLVGVSGLPSWCMVDTSFFLDFGTKDNLRFLRENSYLIRKMFG